MKTAQHCQSCYMPMKKKKEFGREADGKPSADYCCYCYQQGDFTWKPTFEEFVDGNLQFWREGCKDDDEARMNMREVFTSLKRWAE